VSGSVVMEASASRRVAPSPDLHRAVRLHTGDIPRPETVPRSRRMGWCPDLYQPLRNDDARRRLASSAPYSEHGPHHVPRVHTESRPRAALPHASWTTAPQGPPNARTTSAAARSTRATCSRGRTRLPPSRCEASQRRRTSCHVASTSRTCCIRPASPHARSNASTHPRRAGLAANQAQTSASSSAVQRPTTYRASGIPRAVDRLEPIRELAFDRVASQPPRSPPRPEPSLTPARPSASRRP
jgi:hypothetical protein